MAPRGLPALLALEITLAGWSAQDPGGDLSADPRDVRDKSHWGAPRIHSEPLKFGIKISETIVTKYMVKGTRPSSQTWKTFLRNHAAGIAAMDFLIVPIISFRLLFAFVIRGHARRQIVSIGVTDYPTAQWLARQNAYAEPLIGSIRRECLDHVIVFGGAHLRRSLNAYVRNYNCARTHLSLKKDAPLSRSIERTGRINSIPILGGLHHQYCQT